MQPFSRTSAMQCSLLPVRLPNWAPLNRFSYFLIEQAVWLPWRSTLIQWMRNELNLTHASMKNPALKLYEKDAVVLYAISPHVVPCPMDWPAEHLMTGFWFLDPPPGWQPPTALVEFLTAGKPPVYIGFGSAGPGRLKAAGTAISQALEHTDIRAVVTFLRRLFQDRSMRAAYILLGMYPTPGFFHIVPVRSIRAALELLRRHCRRESHRWSSHMPSTSSFGPTGYIP